MRLIKRTQHTRRWILISIICVEYYLIYLRYFLTSVHNNTYNYSIMPASNNWITFAILLIVLVVAVVLLYYCMPSKTPPTEEYVNHDSSYETYANDVDNDSDGHNEPSGGVVPSENVVGTNNADANLSAMKLEDSVSMKNTTPKDCFPKDQLTPQELLPADANSTWAQVVPAGQGSVGDQNFLNAGYHVGINTVGQTLRNANLQLRSEPPNPQVKVSPWLQSTIEPDTNRRGMEIGNEM